MERATESVTTSFAAADRLPISGDDLAMGLRILSDLLEAGLPMTRALQAFEELAPPGWRPAVDPLRVAVREGRGFAHALDESPVRIPTLVVGIVRAGESGGGMASAVRRAAEQSEEQEAGRAAVRAALAYPAAVAIAGAGAIGVMVAVVMPRFAIILADLDQTLPNSTRLVLGGATFARSAFLPALAVVVVASVVLRRALTQARNRRRLDSFLLSLPVIGSLRLSLASARFGTALAALLESGVTLRQGLHTASHVAGDSEIEARLAIVRDDVTGGAAFGRSLRERMALSPTVIRLVSVGEETGRLAHMLAFGSRMERARSERLMKTAVRLIEPALILVFAGIVALVAAALLQAVYAVRPS